MLLRRAFQILLFTAAVVAASGAVLAADAKTKDGEKGFMDGLNSMLKSVGDGARAAGEAVGKGAKQASKEIDRSAAQGRKAVVGEPR